MNFTVNKIGGDPALVPVFDMILEELDKAKKKHPVWPDDPIYCSAYIGEECGELIQACNDYEYEGAGVNQMVEEALHTCVTSIRFLLNIDRFKNRKRKQKRAWIFKSLLYLDFKPLWAALVAAISELFFAKKGVKNG